VPLTSSATTASPKNSSDVSDVRYSKEKKHHSYSHRLLWPKNYQKITSLSDEKINRFEESSIDSEVSEEQRTPEVFLDLSMAKTKTGEDGLGTVTNFLRIFVFLFYTNLLEVRMDLTDHKLTLINLVL